MDPSRISLVVTHADGTTTRWGADEPDTDRLLTDLTFSTSAPGGHKSLTCELLRDLRPQADENLFDTVQAVGAGGRILWEGRMSQFPRQTGTQSSVAPSAAGWSAHLQDDPSFCDIFMDRSTERWQAPPVEWQADRAVSGFSTGGITYTTGNGGFTAQIPNQFQANFTTNELWYIPPPGVRVVGVYHVGTVNALPGGWVQGFDVTNFRDPAGSMTDPLFGAFNGALGENSVAGAKYLLHRIYSNGSGGTPAVGSSVTVTKIGVSSNHVPLQAIFAEPPGVLASDVIAYTVATAAPLLTFTNGPTGSLQPTTFPIPHLVFASPTTASDVIQQANVYHGWDWFVWDNRTFYFQPSGTGTEWHASRADGAQLSFDGDSADSVYNGCIVSFTDAGTGNGRLAGPPGTGFDVESAALQDTDTDNPVNMHGIPRRWLKIDLSFPTTDAGAIELGQIALAEANLAARTGTITLTGLLRSAAGVLSPVAEVRAGDTIRLIDQPGDTPRRIVETSYQHQNRSISLTMNSTANKLQALLERLILGTSG